MPRKGFKHTDATKHKMSHIKKEYYKTHAVPWKGKKRTIEKARQGRLKYYQEHPVWNKGIKWAQEIREKIRGGCLNSSVGMGPRGKWKYTIEEERLEQEQEVIA